MGNDISFLKRYEYSRIFSFLEQILFFLEYSKSVLLSAKNVMRKPDFHMKLVYGHVIIISD